MSDVTSKKCKKCGEVKDISQYSYKRPSGRKPGYQPRCKTCAAEDTRQWNIKNKDTYRERYLRLKYNISENEYHALLLTQENRCPICECLFDFDRWGGQSPVVDHCHRSGVVRGILCNECNRGLGYFKDSKVSLSNAIKYLTDKEQLSETGVTRALHD